jgi:hypothetical protein
MRKRQLNGHGLQTSATYQENSSLSHMSQTNQDIQRYVDHQHLMNHGKIYIPLALGEVYRNNILEKWIKKKYTLLLL